MNKYEALFIIKPDLSEEERKNLFNQISEAVTKNQGNVSQGGVFIERKKLFFPIKKQREGLYYLLSFSVAPAAIKEINHAYKLNENVLRVLITNVE
jgi:small subunit ribosomal protein S6